MGVVVVLGVVVVVRVVVVDWLVLVVVDAVVVGADVDAGAAPPVVVVAEAGAADASMRGVASDVATDVPFLLVAMTETRKVAPTSAAPSTGVAFVSPAMAAHEPPDASQRDHWNA